MALDRADGGSATRAVDRDRLAHALVACARELLAVGGPSAPLDLDLDLDLADGPGLRLGDYLMDSLGFVEWMVELEEQLDVPVMDFADSERTRTLGGLADAIRQQARADRLQDFCERWADATGAGR